MAGTKRLPPAVVEAAEPALKSLETAIRAVLHFEVRLIGTVDALREIGNRDNNTAYISAANRLDELIIAARRRPALPRDTRPGRVLIDALKTDPSATL